MGQDQPPPYFPMGNSKVYHLKSINNFPSTANVNIVGIRFFLHDRNIYSLESGDTTLV